MFKIIADFGVVDVLVLFLFIFVFVTLVCSFISSTSTCLTRHDLSHGLNMI